MKSFEQFLSEKELAKQTKEAYLRHARNMEMLLLGGPVNQDIVDEYMRRHNYPLARFFLRIYLEWAGRKDINIVKPTGREKRARKEPAFLDKAEVDMMLDYCRQHGLKAEELIIRIGFEAGLRAGEYRTIKPSGIRQDKRCTIKLKGKGGDETVLLIRPETYAALQEYIAANHIELDQPVFPFSRWQVWHKLKVVGKAALDQNVWPHRLRHSFARHLRQNGMDMFALQKVMRHKSITSTEVYSGVSDEEVAEKWEKAMK